ncbi:MAG: hypothetical protein ACP5GN_04900 [Fervidicoccaceae archaeon]|jgi:hypothetical protein
MTEKRKDWVEGKLKELDDAYSVGKKKIEERSEKLLKELENKLREKERELLDAFKKEK